MYAATVNGERLIFEVHAVWRRNMIIRDKETGTLWQHATGEALIGPLKGEQLEVLGGERTTWAAWRNEHPKTMLVIGPDKWPGLFPLPFTERVLEAATRSGFVPGLTFTDRRLPQNEEISGIQLAGESRAYPLKVLKQEQVVNDQLGGVPISIFYETQADRVRAYYRPAADMILTFDDDISSLRPLHLQRGWWGGWYEFHPGSDIYSGESSL